MTRTKYQGQSGRQYKSWCHSRSSPGVRILQFALGSFLFALFVAVLGRASIAGPPEAYQKKWRDEAVNQRIDRNIEQYRKGDAVLEVVDAAGKPVSGVRVELQQTGHEFLFGCNAFVLGQLPTAEENRRYEEAFVRLFNFATVPLYWEGTEPTQGELRYQEGSRDMWRRPPADRYPPWAAKHGITLKGHPLLWHAYNPAWLPKDADQLRELYRKRFREIAGRYGDKIPIFDVVNESLVCSKTYPLYSDDRAYVGWAFAEAAPLFPDSTTLMINEVTSYNFKPAETNPYLAQVKTLLEQGAKIKGIGLQFHYFRARPSTAIWPATAAIPASCWTSMKRSARSGCRCTSRRSPFRRRAPTAKSFKPKSCATTIGCGSAHRAWRASRGGTWATARRSRARTRPRADCWTTN